MISAGKSEGNQCHAARLQQAGLDRETFSISRDAEYFDVRQLQTMTGQPVERFAEVILKELLDNALDAAETAGIAPHLFIKYRTTGRYLVLVVGDNGTGIPADTVVSILNFQTLTSDKAAYRSTTRGAQGNALKTVLGIPVACGCRRPVVVEARGVRHIIRIGIDPAGEVRTDHAKQIVAQRGGTRIALALPIRQFSHFQPREWARSFSIFNPHALVKIWKTDVTSKQGHNARRRIGKTYPPSVAYHTDWRKLTSKDPTSPWWYDDNALAKLMFSHIAKARRGGEDLALRRFLTQFAGMTGKAKLKAVCDQFPHLQKLTDFDGKEEAVSHLLVALKEKTRPPSAALLGEVGENHFRRRFNEWFGVKRYWYKKVSVNVEGASFVVEAALAETERLGRLFHGCNFSPTFDDPLAQNCLKMRGASGYGVAGFLREGHAHPRHTDNNQHTAAAFHLICPALEPLDKGKTRIKTTPAMIEAAETALWKVTKELYQEEERRRKDAARQERADRDRITRRANKLDLTEIMDDVIPAAVQHATGGEYQVSSHTLFYSARPLSQKLTSKELDSHYFEQTLLPAYQRKHGPILLPDGTPAIYYEPRGTLYEPHTAREVALGTREVNEYHFPAHLYDKILFIEKQGLWPVFKRAKLAEQFDMAIVAGEGYSCEACRILFGNAGRDRQYQLFVLHDCDPFGYNIARTLREETRRMPGHCANVIDLGLLLADAIDMGLQTEEFTRKKAIPQALKLSDLEREYFEGVQRTWNPRPSWLCRRVELNAFTSPDLIAYAVRKLLAGGVRPKVIPPHGVLTSMAQTCLHDAISSQVREAALELMSLDDIIKQIADGLEGRIPLTDTRLWVEEHFKTHPTVSWNDALKGKILNLVSEQVEAERMDICKKLKRLVQGRLK